MTLKSVASRIKKLFLEILPVFLFFLIMFHILAVSKALVLKQYGITPGASAFAVIGALVVAKVILIADRLPFLNLYPGRPLIWNVILKTIVFGIITFIFLLIEELVHQSHVYGSVALAYRHLPEDIVWPAFWAREIWLNVLILFYCAAMEMSKVVGFDRVKEIFFGKWK